MSSVSRVNFVFSAVFVLFLPNVVNGFSPSLRVAGASRDTGSRYHSSNAPIIQWSSTSSDATTDTLDLAEHIAILDDNLKRHSKRGLLDRMELEEEDDWEDTVHMSTRYALLSHGGKNGMDGPIHNYVNFGGCSAFQIGRADFLRVPAARVADPGMDQETWSMILQRLKSDPENVVENYQGYRSTLTDRRRFYIQDAVVWNCFDADGEYYGQAMLFDRQKVAYSD